MSKILIIDDDLEICSLVKRALEKEGHQVTSQPDPIQAEYMPLDLFDLILLDLMLPGIDGLELLKYIRRQKALQDLPVILLTAKGTELDKVIGLELGADDYLSKPFGIYELLARVKALFRRTGQKVPSEAEQLIVGDLWIDQLTHQVKKRGQLLELAPKEFSLLVVFAQNLERVFTRDELLLKIWGMDFLGESRTVDVHIKNLRKKIEDNPEEPTYIKTVRGVGYKMVKKGQ